MTLSINFQYTYESVCIQLCVPTYFLIYDILCFTYIGKYIYLDLIIYIN